jgi:hypothetical protein
MPLLEGRYTPDPAHPEIYYDVPLAVDQSGTLTTPSGGGGAANVGLPADPVASSDSGVWSLISLLKRVATKLVVGGGTRAQSLSTTLSAESVSGTLATLNNSVLISAVNAGTISLDIAGTYSGTITVYGTVVATGYKKYLANIPAGQIGAFLIDCAGYQNVSAEMTAYTSGTATINMQSSIASKLPAMGQGSSVDATRVTFSGESSLLNLGSLNATTANLSCSNSGSVGIEVFGSYVGVLTIEVSMFGLSWTSIGSLASGQTGSTVFNTAGYGLIRARMSAWTSGSPAVILATSIAPIGSANLAMGQGLATSATQRVVLPNNLVSGTLAANLATTPVLNAINAGSVSIDITGAFGGTIVLQGSATGTGWKNLSNFYSPTIATFNVGGYSQIRAIMTGYGSGSPVVTIQSSTAPSDKIAIDSWGANIGQGIGGYYGSLRTNLAYDNINSSLSALNAFISVAAANAGTVSLEVSGTYVGIITISGSVTPSGTRKPIQALASGQTGVFTIPVAGYQNVFATMTAYTSGTAVIDLQSSIASQGATPVIGNGTGAAAQRVTLGSELMPAMTFNASGLNSPLIDVTNAGTIAVDILGTYSGVLRVRGRVTGGGWNDIQDFGGGLQKTFLFNVAGYSEVRITSPTWVSGSATVIVQSSTVPLIPAVQPVSLDAIGTAVAKSYGTGTGGTLRTVSASESANANLAALSAQTFVLSVNAASVSIEISNTYVGVIEIAGAVSISGTKKPLLTLSSGQIGVFTLPVSGYGVVFATMTAYTSGTAVVAMQSSIAPQGSTAVTGNGNATAATRIISANESTSVALGSPGAVTGNVSAINAGTVGIEVSGVYAGILVVEGSIGGTVWQTITALTSGQTGFINSSIAGYSLVRARMSTWTSGAATVALQTSLAGGSSSGGVIQGLTGLTDRSGSITVGGTAQVLAVANSTRNISGFWLQNTSLDWLYVNDLTTANITSYAIAPGAEWNPAVISNGAISIFGAITGQTWIAREWNAPSGSQTLIVATPTGQQPSTGSYPMVPAADYLETNSVTWIATVAGVGYAVGERLVQSFKSTGATALFRWYNLDQQTLITSPTPAQIASNLEIFIKADTKGRSIVRNRTTTGTTTSVASTTTSATVLAANSLRGGAKLCNNSTSLFYGLYGSGVASSSNYSFILSGLVGGIPGIEEIPYGYEGIVTGVWATANGNLIITEMV